MQTRDFLKLAGLMIAQRILPAPLLSFWQQAAGAAHPELAQADGAGALLLRHQQQRDQVPGDDEEHLHTEEATAEPAVIGVVDQHGTHRDRR